MWLAGDGDDARSGLSRSGDLVRERHLLSRHSGADGTAQVFARLQADELRGLGEAVEERGHFGAPARARAVVILPADDQFQLILPMSNFAPASATPGIPPTERSSTSATERFDAARRCSSAGWRMARAR